jgi:hypothetical protein
VREGFKPEGGEKGGARWGVERAVEEEMFSRLGFAAASAEEVVGFEVRLVGAEVTGASAASSEQGQLAAREQRVEAREGRTGRGGGDGAKLAARRPPKRQPGGFLSCFERGPACREAPGW